MCIVVHLKCYFNVASVFHAGRLGNYPGGVTRRVEPNRC